MSRADPSSAATLAERIFAAAAAMPRDARKAFLARECASDISLAAEIESLLEHHDADTRFLEDSAIKASRPPGPGASPADWGLPERIGRYRLLRVIGEGGMGVVCAAEQDSPRRAVALKLIRSGLFSGSLSRRFELEAAVLGRLQHPGIAQIYEAGSGDADGRSRPYLAMELIDGLPLIQHSDQANLDARQRLELIARVCDAVQHAHERGVVHRDLKPGNILVDRAGQPKILDFGVAMLTDDSVTRTMHTREGDLVGTLAYMSPEQVSGARGGGTEGTGIDSRADIYSLGVILFELLSGRLPLELSGMPLGEAVIRVREADPMRLSGISRVYRGDIETIVSKCLQKDRTRRYATAADLAADIRAHLAGLPITARQDSALYVLRKQIRRYRGAVAAGALFVVGLAAFAAYASWQAEHNAALARAESAAKTQAQSERARADETAVKLREELALSTIERGRLSSRTGNVPLGLRLLWKEHLAGTAPEDTHWGLWEAYSRSPYLRSARVQNGAVRGITLAADGVTLLVCGDRSDALMVDAVSLSVRGKLVGHTAAVNSIAAHPTQSLACTSSTDGRVLLWDTRAGTQVAELPVPDGFGKMISAAFSADGETVLAGGEHGHVVAWNLQTHDIVWQRPSRTGGASAHRIACSPNGAWVAVISGPRIGVWGTDRGVPTGEPRWFVGHTDNVNSITFSADGAWLYSGSEDRDIRRWSTADGTSHAFRSPNGTIRGLAASPDGRTLHSVGWWAVQRWSIDDTLPRAEAMKQTQWAPVPEGLHGVAVGAGQRVLTGSGIGYIRVLDDRASPGLLRLPAHEKRSSCTFGPDPRVLATSDGNGLIRLWDSRTGELLASLAGSTGRSRSLLFHPTLPYLLASGDDRTLRLWDLRTGSELARQTGINDVTNKSIALSPDGTLVAAAIYPTSVALFSVPDLQPVESFGIKQLDTRESLSVCFSPDGSRLLSIGRVPTRQMWSVPDGQALFTLPGPSTNWTAAYAEDGRTIVSGNWARQISLWDADGRELGTLDGHNGLVADVRARPGTPWMIASSASDGTVRLWDLRARRSLMILDQLDDWEVLTIAFSPDGSRLAATGSDGSVLIWDLEYFDRHIAGHVEAAADEFAGSPMPRLAALRSWAAAVLARPEPGSTVMDTGPGPTGIDLEQLAAWGRAGPK